MTATDPESLSQDAAREARKAKTFTLINKADGFFTVLGLSWVTPMLRAIAGDNPKAQYKEIWRLLGVPLIAIVGFLLIWASLAPTVQTSLGAIPGPGQVWEQAVNLHEDAGAKRDKISSQVAKIEEANERYIANGEPDRVKDVAQFEAKLKGIGQPSYYQQIWTSIKTVFFDRDDDRLRHRGQRRLFCKVLPDLCHHRDALLALANSDQHRPWCCQHRQGPR